MAVQGRADLIDALLARAHQQTERTAAQAARLDKLIHSLVAVSLVKA